MCRVLKNVCVRLCSIWMVYGVVFDLARDTKKLEDLRERMGRDPDFWNLPKEASELLKQQKSLEATLERAATLQAQRADLEAALELVAEDVSFLEECVATLEAFESSLETLELHLLLSEPLDEYGALMSIQAGAGGTESCDWAAMLWRMYERFCQKMGWQMEMLSLSGGESAGIRSVECKVTGERAYGYLKAESGVHRLIRISPFDSSARRHTSFASVHVSALVDDSIEVDIASKDLRVDTYRASGAGGQHVNKTDSAVRITHIPTGIVVQSQSQRSQHQNREQCMEMLRSRLYAFELSKQKEERELLAGEKSDISFGSQIRTYTLHPFKLVKDHRSSYETSSPSQVLDGDLMAFIKSYITHKNKSESSK